MARKAKKDDSYWEVVWKSLDANQAHPFLAERDCEEQERSIPSSMKMPERPSESAHTQTVEITSRTCKTRRKRKTTVAIRPAVKAKSAKVEEQDNVSKDSTINYSR